MIGSSSLRLRGMLAPKHMGTAQSDWGRDGARDT